DGEIVKRQARKRHAASLRRGVKAPSEDLPGEPVRNRRRWSDRKPAPASAKEPAMQNLRKSGLGLLLVLLFPVLLPDVFPLPGQEAGRAPPYEPLPAGMQRLTFFGERADWSPDGKRIIFLEKTFGDVFEIEL